MVLSGSRFSHSSSSAAESSASSGDGFEKVTVRVRNLPERIRKREGGDELSGLEEKEADGGFGDGEEEELVEGLAGAGANFEGESAIIVFEFRRSSCGIRRDLSCGAAVTTAS